MKVALDEIVICNDCGEIVNEIFDWNNVEGWSVCKGCRNIEGDTTHMYECPNCLERYTEDEVDDDETCIKCRT